MIQGGGYADDTFVAEFYDHVVTHVIRRDLEFYMKYSQMGEGPVLELACGTGRLLIPMARAGIDMTGLDYSDAMLAVCKKNLASEPAAVRQHVKLFRGDMRGFKLHRKFSMAMIPFRSFHHLVTELDQRHCLSAIHQHLLPGGRLLLDLLNPNLELIVQRGTEEYGDEPGFELNDGRSVHRRIRIVEHDPVAQIMHMEFLYYVKAESSETQRLVHRFPMRYLFRYEVEHLLARAGFEVEALFDDFTGTPFGEKPLGNLIVVAKKRNSVLKSDKPIWDAT